MMKDLIQHTQAFYVIPDSRYIYGTPVCSRLESPPQDIHNMSNNPGALSLPIQDWWGVMMWGLNSILILVSFLTHQASRQSGWRFDKSGLSPGLWFPTTPFFPPHRFWSKVKKKKKKKKKEDEKRSVLIFGLLVPRWFVNWLDASVEDHFPHSEPRSQREGKWIGWVLLQHVIYLYIFFSLLLPSSSPFTRPCSTTWLGGWGFNVGRIHHCASDWPCCHGAFMHPPLPTPHPFSQDAAYSPGSKKRHRPWLRQTDSLGDT